jgi:hypothetical protein
MTAWKSRFREGSKLDSISSVLGSLWSFCEHCNERLRSIKNVKFLNKLNDFPAGLENRNYGRMGSDALTTRQSYIHKKLALTSLTSGGRSVGTVRSWTRATEFVLFFVYDFPAV